MSLAPRAGDKSMLYLAVRKVLGKDTPNYPQGAGDCVSQGGKNAAEYLTCTEIVLGGERQKFRPVFPPFYYGTSRVYVGKGKLGNGDGSVGAWLAKAVMAHGTLFADEPGVPAYSGAVARAWGDPSPKNDLDKWAGVAKAFLVRSAAKVTTWDQLVSALASGYPVPVCSDVGFEMHPRADGFHARGREPWAHCMCIIGVDDREKDPYAVILNSWGDVHGRLKDFDDGHALPPGCLRVRRAVVEVMLAAGDSFAFSSFDGFADRADDLEDALFDLVGAD
jgi:hypothetical protein